MKKCALLIAVIAILAMAATPAFATGLNWFNNFTNSPGGGSTTAGFGNPAANVAENTGSASGFYAPTIQTSPFTMLGDAVTSNNASTIATTSANFGELTHTTNNITDFGNITNGYFGPGFTTSAAIFMSTAMTGWASGGGSHNYTNFITWEVGLDGYANNEFQVEPSYSSSSTSSVHALTINTSDIKFGGGTTFVAGTGVTVTGATATISLQGLGSGGGWYTFQDQFYSNDGNLAATISVLSPTSTVVGTWNVITSTPIASLMGNSGTNDGTYTNYSFTLGDSPNVDTAWAYIGSTPADLAITNVSLSYAAGNYTSPEPISMIFFGTGLVAVSGYMARRKMARKAA